MVGKVVHTSSAELVRYHEQHLSNGDYHLEEGKVRGEFIGTLADEWGTQYRTDSEGRSKVPGVREIGYHSIEQAEAAAAAEIRTPGD